LLDLTGGEGEEREKVKDGREGKEDERGRERGREGMTRTPILQCWQLCRHCGTISVIQRRVREVLDTAVYRPVRCRPVPVVDLLF